MENFTQMNVFFIISSVGFVIVALLIAIVLYYFIRAMRSFSRVINRAERDIEQIGDTTKEILDDVRDSSIFNLFFKKHSKTHKRSK